MVHTSFVIAVFILATMSLFSAEEGGPQEVCLLELEIGNCTKYIVKFYFDQQNKKCAPFVFTGCGGNGNNFETLESCQETCE